MGTGSQTFFHCHPEGKDPGTLLDPDNQVSEPWGEPEPGPCDKCGGEGTTAYECFSCMEAGSDPDCPACQGRGGFGQTRPPREGRGGIPPTPRPRGAGFPRPGGPYRLPPWKSDAGGGGEGVGGVGGG